MPADEQAGAAWEREGIEGHVLDETAQQAFALGGVALCQRPVGR